MWRVTKSSSTNVSSSRRSVLSAQLGILLGCCAVCPVSQAETECTRPKNAALYTYDASIDGYVLQYLFDDGIDLGENPPGYERMEDSWCFVPPPGWNGDYPPTHVHTEPSGQPMDGTVGGGQSDLQLSGSGLCNEVPPVIVRGQRMDGGGGALPFFVVRAPRQPINSDGWFEPIAARRYQGIPQPDATCDQDQFVNSSTCYRGCGGLSMGARFGDLCTFQLISGTQTLTCSFVGPAASTVAWHAQRCE